MKQRTQLALNIAAIIISVASMLVNAYSMGFGDAMVDCISRNGGAP